MIKSRIAPTPSGFLHRGNAFNFLLTDALVKKKQGSLLLRIDDMDQGRIRLTYVEHIFSTILQLGISYDEGPRSMKDLEEKWSQLHRLNDYNSNLDRLLETGLIYACDCSRREVAENSENGLYNGRCRERNLGFEKKGAAWRIDSREVPPINWTEGNQKKSIDLKKSMGDFVIRKKDGKPAYQICSLTDDVNFGISLIVRGEDLLESTAAQLWLAELIGAEQWLGNLQLLHHTLLVNQSGQKLSKSAGAEAVTAGGKAIPESKLKELKKAVENYLENLELKLE